MSVEHYLEHFLMHCVRGMVFAFVLFCCGVTCGEQAALAQAPPEIAILYRVRIENPGKQLEASSKIEIADMRVADLTGAESFLATPVKDGSLLLTTYDAIHPHGEFRYFLTRQNQLVEAQLWSADPWMNLAMLRTETPVFPPVTIATTNTLQVNDLLRVEALRGTNALLLEATVAALDHAALENANGPARTVHEYGGLVSVRSLTPIPTGTPLLDAKKSFRLLASGQKSRTAKDQSLGIPVDVNCVRSIEALIRGEPLAYGFLGLEPGALSDLPNTSNLKGVYVRQVMLHSPAQRAGVLEENPRTSEVDIISKINDESLDSPRELLSQISRLPFETKVKLNILRGKPGANMKPLQLECTLAKRFAPPVRPSFSQTPSFIWRGLKVNHYTAIEEYAPRARLVDPAGCVAIVEVKPDSPAWKAGLRPGMFLTKLGEQRVGSESDFQAAAMAAKGPTKVATTARAEGVRLEGQIYEIPPE